MWASSLKYGERLIQGGSHDQTTMLPIKAGVGIIYMGAYEKYGVESKIVVAGINYFKGHKFRSTAVVEFGLPYQMSEQDHKDYKTPEGKKEVINDFLDTISRYALTQQNDSRT